MTRLIAAILLLYTSAQAGLPPTSVQGQYDASAKTKFNFQVPYNQFSDLGGIKSYLDTGNRNLLLNSSFENSTATTSWTATTITPAVETSIIHDGKQALKLPYSFNTGGISQSITPTVNTLGTIYEASCWVNDTAGSQEVCGLSNGVKQNCNTVPATGTWQLVTTNFVGPANGTSVGVLIDATGTKSGNTYVDDCYVGPTRNVTSAPLATDWSTLYTFTPSAAFGTTTSADWRSRRVGDHIEVEGYFISGTLAASIPFLSLPASLTIDTTKLRSTSQATSVGSYWCSTVSGTPAGYATNGDMGAIFYDGSTNNQIYLTGAGSTSAFTKLSTAIGNFCGNTGGLNVRFSFPVSTWTSLGTAYRADSTPASWTGYQDSISGGCSTTSTTYADPSACTGIATTQITARNITCSQAASSADAITCTLPRSGNYKIKAKANLSAVAALTASARLVDGSAIVIDRGTSQYIGTAGKVASLALSGDYNASAAGTFTFKVQLATDTSTLSITQGTATNSAAIQWEVLEEDAPMPAPYLVGLSNLVTKAITASTAATTDTQIYLCNAVSGSVTLTLPLAASNKNTQFTIKKTDSSSNACTLGISGGDTIDGQSSLGVITQYGSYTVISDGSVWWIF